MYYVYKYAQHNNNNKAGLWVMTMQYMVFLIVHAAYYGLIRSRKQQQLLDQIMVLGNTFGTVV